MFLVRAPGPLLVMAVLGCGERSPRGAVGANDEISVFTNFPRGSAVEERLRSLFEYPVDVVGTENAFRLDVVSRDQIAVHRLVKNQVIAVDASRPDDWARDLPRWLDGRHGLLPGVPFRVLVTDRWAAGQTSLFLVGWSARDLLDLLSGADSTALRREFEDAVVTGLTKTLLAGGEDTEPSRRVARERGWALCLPPGFFSEALPRDRVKWNARDPVRLLLVQKVDASLPLTAAAWAPVLDALLAEANDGDSVLVARTTVFPDRFQDGPALKWEGVWQNERYLIGGPFRAFAVPRGERSYLLVGQVFAPGQDKVASLRQVEAVLRTFHEVR